jgi:hypothetical protein
MPFFENRSTAKASDECEKRIAEDAKKVSPGNPQNRQNLGSQSVPQALGRVQVIELPQARRYRRTFAVLQSKPPALIPVDRWQQAIADGRAFLVQWGGTAERLGWTSDDLLGLHKPPENPHPSYSRLSRYNETGLLWLLQGKTVVALTADTATIKNVITGNVTVFRKHNKPPLGPLGDSLLDLK